MSWEELAEFINNKMDIYNSPLPQKIEIYEKAGIPIYYSLNSLDELITDYVCIIVLFTYYLKKSVEQEKYEYSSLIRDMINMEEKEFIKNLIIYHFPEDYNSKN